MLMEGLGLLRPVAYHRRHSNHVPIFHRALGSTLAGPMQPSLVSPGGLHHGFVCHLPFLQQSWNRNRNQRRCRISCRSCRGSASLRRTAGSQGSSGPSQGRLSLAPQIASPPAFTVAMGCRDRGYSTPGDQRSFSRKASGAVGAGMSSLIGLKRLLLFVFFSMYTNGCIHSLLINGKGMRFHSIILMSSRRYYADLKFHRRPHALLFLCLLQLGRTLQHMQPDGR